MMTIGFMFIQESKESVIHQPGLLAGVDILGHYCSRLWARNAPWNLIRPSLLLSPTPVASRDAQSLSTALPPGKETLGLAVVAGFRLVLHPAHYQTGLLAFLQV